MLAEQNNIQFTSRGRPIMKVALIPAERVFIVLTILFFIFDWAYFLDEIGSLPDTIPTHWDANGNINGYGSKWVLLIMVIFPTILSLVLSLLCNIPHHFNLAGMTVTVENAK